MQGLRYLTFIAATDVIYELDSLGAPFGLTISSDGLRSLARMLMAGRQQQTEPGPGALKQNWGMRLRRLPAAAKAG